eukprot:FR738012.1.p4 GENE.FR738012.1~~FR738012.1.p4  ORF type:complete len:101 (-),score=12.31 FR738012.1:501-803(-)
MNAPHHHIHMCQPPTRHVASHPLTTTTTHTTPPHPTSRRHHTTSRRHHITSRRPRHDDTTPRHDDHVTTTPHHMHVGTCLIVQSVAVAWFLFRPWYTLFM